MGKHFWRKMNLPIAVIRFVVFTPTILYWVFAGDHHKLIRSHIELHNGTYGSAPLTGEELADKWGTILFLWNLLVWWPAMMGFPPLNLPFTVVDTVITVFLSRATHYQVGYIPLNLSTCHDKEGLESQRPAGANESFFAAAGRLNGTAASSTAMCLDFVKEAQYGVALSFFYALVSLLGILAFPGAIREFRRDDESILTMAKEVLSLTWGCLSCMFKWPAIIVYFAVVYTPILFFRCLPMDLKAPVRSARRYAAKTTIGAEQKIEIALSELGNNVGKAKNTVGPYQNSGGTPTELSQFLGVYDMLVMVAKHLHYSDLVSLSAVSKSVRDSVLPPNDVPRRLAIFGRYTCNPGEKYKCWGCTSQICDGCEEYFPIPQAIVFHHIDNCVPYCASCYHTHVVRDSRYMRSRSDGNPTCVCAPKYKFAQRRTAFWSIFNRHTCYTEPLGDSRTHRQICRSCSQLDGKELFSRKARSGMTMLKKGLKDNGEEWKTCAVLGCGRGLGRGPRYWVCKKYSCDRECKSTVHQAWGRADDDGVGEAIV